MIQNTDKYGLIARFDRLYIKHFFMNSIFFI
jgi:hypothetical protein